ncbi:MAG TPA: type II toxin-antitoxin system VapC family toxin [Allosphingosinicella sp.]
MSTRPERLLLDTNALIFLANGGLSAPAMELVVAAGMRRGVLISPVSAWEIGMLSRAGAEGGPRLRFNPDPQTWFAALQSRPIFAEAPFTAAIAIAAAFLPGAFHKDPADRLLVATSRAMDVPIMTRDRQILAYGEAGHVQAIAC